MSNIQSIVLSSSKVVPLLLKFSMDLKKSKWFYLIILSLLWGSSYILIKKSLIGLNPLELGSLRILITTLVLLIIGYKSLRGLSKNNWKWLAITGYVGTFFPAFLFAYAQTQIDSAVAAILNSLTPLLNLILGFSFFGVIVFKRQLWGVIIGLLGSVLLIYSGIQFDETQQSDYIFLILLASLCYALNLHFLKIYLKDVNALAMTVGNFVFMAPLAAIILIFSGFFKSQNFQSPELYSSLFYVVILAVVSSAFAKYLFNKLIKISSAVFASSVTYTLPIVALFWGISDGEQISFLQILATVIILVGIWLAHKKNKAA